MQETKIGDVVLIRALVTEVRILQKGKAYKIRVVGNYTYDNEMLVEPKDIVE